jgi:membrane associated rhomboid family serine protease
VSHGDGEARRHLSALPIACGAVTTPMQTCYRHHDRRAGVVCQRCDRPICPDCMHQASVGFHCPECTKQGAQKVVRPRQLLNQRPAVTQALIAINSAVFIIGVGAGLETKDRFTIDFGLIARAINPFTRQLIGVAEGEWWRLVTSGFLHANIIHIALNMWVLYSLGKLLEPALGRVNFGLVYFVSLLGGSLGVMILSPNSLTVGASGAVFGLMGAAAAVFRARRIDLLASGLGAMIFLNLAFTFSVRGISIGGHLGGLVTGFVAAWLIEDFGPKTIKDPTITRAVVAALGVVLAVAAVMVAGNA